MNNYKTNVRIPRLADFDTVLNIYYENIEIGSREMKRLFKSSKTGGTISGTTIQRLKQIVYEEEAVRETPKWNRGTVNTKVAFEVWGIDIEEIERRRKKMQKLAI